MSDEEALKVIEERMLCSDCNSVRGIYCVETNCKVYNAIETIREALEKQDADGCVGCKCTNTSEFMRHLAYVIKRNKKDCWTGAEE